jgi:hypothetical protein
MSTIFLSNVNHLNFYPAPLFCEVFSSFERQSNSAIRFKLCIRRYRDGCLLPSLLQLCIFASSIYPCSPLLPHISSSLTTISARYQFGSATIPNSLAAGEQCFQALFVFVTYLPSPWLRYPFVSSPAVLLASATAS